VRDDDRSGRGGGDAARTVQDLDRARGSGAPLRVAGRAAGGGRGDGVVGGRRRATRRAVPDRLGAGPGDGGGPRCPPAGDGERRRGGGWQPADVGGAGPNRALPAGHRGSRGGDRAALPGRAGRRPPV
ncbi:MAG: hypothetical protein AVDCRST_MAG19-3963, partial [uncultured Thermomicrobiales bacterium]